MSFEDKIDAEIPTATNLIYQNIAENAKRGESKDINRASSMPTCAKARWYKKQGNETEPMSPRTQLNFMMGHIAETVVLHLIKTALVGPDKLYSEIDFGEEVDTFLYQDMNVSVYKQRTLIAAIAGFYVTAHLDGMGKRNSDGRWEIIEVKSAADYGFDLFVTNGPTDYLPQSHACMRTDLAIERGVNETRYFYVKKSTGHLWDRLITFDQKIFDEVGENLKIANGEAEPKRPFVAIEEKFRSKPTGRKILFWRCSYCAFTQKCWPEAKMEFKSGKPIWVVEEKK